MRHIFYEYCFKVTKIKKEGDIDEILVILGFRVIINYEF